LGVEEQRVNVVVDFIEPPASMSRLGDAYAGEAWIVIWSSEDELQVPTSALFREGGDWHAFEVVDGFARQVKLEIGQRNATVAQLLSGLEAGAQVIAYPNDMIRDGVQVQAKNGK
jgi:HlyD family secretion protein